MTEKKDNCKIPVLVSIVHVLVGIEIFLIGWIMNDLASSYRYLTNIMFTSLALAIANADHQTLSFNTFLLLFL